LRRGEQVADLVDDEQARDRIDLELVIQAPFGKGARSVRAGTSTRRLLGSNGGSRILLPPCYHYIPIQGDPPAPSLSCDRWNYLRLGSSCVSVDCP
jgi:hypothetical protein